MALNLKAAGHFAFLGRMAWFVVQIAILGHLAAAHFAFGLWGLVEQISLEGFFALGMCVMPKNARRNRDDELESGRTFCIWAAWSGWWLKLRV